MNATDEKEALALLAALAFETPVRRGKYSNQAKVDWDVVIRARTLLAQLGYDVPAAIEQTHRRMADANAAAMERYFRRWS